MFKKIIDTASDVAGAASKEINKLPIIGWTPIEEHKRNLRIQIAELELRRKSLPGYQETQDKDTTDYRAYDIGAIVMGILISIPALWLMWEMLR